MLQQRFKRTSKLGNCHKKPAEKLFSLCTVGQCSVVGFSASLNNEKLFKNSGQKSHHWAGTVLLTLAIGVPLQELLVLV